MKAKTKLIMSIMSICLVCAVFAIGVFALKTANLKIGGDVSFQATGVEATISNADLKTGADGTTSMTKPEGFVTGGTINNTMTQSDINTTFATWQNLDFEFNANGDDIVFSFDIKNDSTNVDHYIEIDYDYSFGTTTTNIDVFPGANNDYILEPNASESTTFSLVLRVINKELDVASNSLSVTIYLKHQEGKLLTTTDSTNYYYENIKYTVSGSNATVAGYQNSPTDVAIPAVVTDGVNNYVVTSIGSGAFSSCVSLTSITFSNSITAIENSAFEDCESLISVVIPVSVTEINNAVFSGCCSINSIIIPNSVTSIGAGAFVYALSFEKLIIPNSVISIGAGAFTSCGLTSVVIPDSVTSDIGAETFKECLYLSSVIIGNGVTGIGNKAFYGSYNCGVKIGSSVTSIGDYAFSNSGLDSIVILPDSVITIGDYAFSECPNLSSITIGSGLTSIGACAFEGCGNLTSIVVSRGNSVYDNRNNCNAIIETSTNTLVLGCKNTIIPSSVTNIGDSAFAGSYNLTSIVIPNSVGSIGDYAFSGCSLLNAITIGSGVTSIGESAFLNNLSLDSVVFVDPEGWASNGVSLDLSDPAQNATLLKSTYCSYSWNKA